MFLFFNIYFIICLLVFVFFFFKQKTAYEMRISDWSSDVCSSDLIGTWARYSPDLEVEAERRIEDLIAHRITPTLSENLAHLLEDTVDGRVTRFVWLRQIGRASCRERVCQYV